jgi:hypothetical protein
LPQVPWTAPTRRRTSRAPQSAGLAHLVGRRHRAALRCLGPPARARAEAAGGGDGEGRRVLPGLGCLAQVFPHLVSQARFAQVASQAQRRCELSPGRRFSRSRLPARLLVAARAGTGAPVADATFLVGISSRRSIGARSAPPAPWISPDRPSTRISLGHTPPHGQTPSGPHTAAAHSPALTSIACSVAPNGRDSILHCCNQTAWR